MQKYVHDLFYSELNYYNGYESFCYQNCLRILLQSMGLRDSWAYINASMSLVYQDQEVMQHKNIRDLLPEYSDCIRRIYYDDSVKSEEVFIDNVNFIINNKMPIIVGVDTYYLNYASNYKKNHAIHTLIMCGYDSLTNDVYVIDWYAPWFFKGCVKKEDFLKARDSKNECDGTIYSGAPIKNNWAYVEKSIPLIKIEDLLHRVLMLSSKQYFSDACDNEVVGIKALMCFKEDITGIDSVNYSNIYYQFYTAIKRHYFFKQYLENYLDYCYDEFIFKIISLMNRSISTLEIISMLLLKQSKIFTARTSERIANNLDIVIKNETIINQLLNSYLNKIQDKA